MSGFSAPTQCGRWAQAMYGELALCWQHEEQVIHYMHADERTVPAGMSESRFQHGAIETLEEWLAAKRDREAREADELAAQPPEDAARDQPEAAAGKAAARVRRRRATRSENPPPRHLRSVE